MPQNLNATLDTFEAVIFSASGVISQDLTIAVQKVADNLDPTAENSNVNLRTVYSMYETLVKTDYQDGGRSCREAGRNLKVT